MLDWPKCEDISFSSVSYNVETLIILLSLKILLFYCLVFESDSCVQTIIHNKIKLQIGHKIYILFIAVLALGAVTFVLFVLTQSLSRKHLDEFKGL